MPRACSVDLRERSLQALASGRSVTEGCHLRYLPPYSPDFNPIEHVFSTLKARLRAAASRTFDTLATAIGAALDVITADHLANCYRHCGYDLPTPRQDIRERGEDR